MNVSAIYDGSDGEATKGLYEKLTSLGERGMIALNLFRACKASQRAKAYRRKFKGMAYEKKNWSMQNLVNALAHQTELVWGWKEDPLQEYHKWVLYVDLPTGQVSFHSASPLRPIFANLPEIAQGYYSYAGDWDGSHLSGKRISAFVEAIINGTEMKKIPNYPAPAQIEALFDQPTLF